MEEKLYLKQARKGMNTVALTVLAYYGILNFFTILVTLIDLLVYVIRSTIQSQAVDMDMMMEYIMDSVTRNGWGYLLSIAVGTLILLIWKGKAFWKEEMFAKELKLYINNGFMEFNNGHYSFTPKGMYVSNYILSTFLSFDGGNAGRLAGGI